MDDNKFWLRIWQTVAVAIVLVAAGPSACTAYESKRIADAIEAGADPIDARCGIAGTANAGSTICTLRAASPNR